MRLAEPIAAHPPAAAQQQEHQPSQPPEDHPKLRTTVLRLGEHRSRPRIYLEGRWLIDAGFEPGSSYAIHYQHSRIEISLSDEGRSVTAKKRGGVIDLNCSAIRDSLGQVERVTVHAEAGSLTITASRTEIRKARRRLTANAVSLFAGGGLLSEAARQAGFRTIAAIEVNPRYADIYQLNHRGRLMNCSVEEVAWEQLQTLAESEPIGLLEMGIPCEPYSKIRRLSRGTQEKRNSQLPPEAHELGDMVYWAIKAADLLNPHTVLVEQVPAFLKSGAGFILQLALERLGYQVGSRVLDPRDFGALTGRKRAVVVGTTFAQVNWPPPSPPSPPETQKAEPARRLGELLDPVPDGSDLWFNAETKPWLYEHWRKQTAKGNGFEPPKLTANSGSCPTIKKRYFAGQGDSPVVQHPTKPDHHRWLTVAEVRRLMGLPDQYQLGEAKTTAGEVLGQGVQTETFAQLIRSITQGQ